MSFFNAIFSSMGSVASEVTSLLSSHFGDEEEVEDSDNYEDDSPTSWTRHPWETDEDYQDRMDDQIGMMGGD